MQGEVNGVESVAVDSTDPNAVYLAANYGPPFNNSPVSGEVLVSPNRGLSWSALGLAAQGVYMGPNDPYRGTSGERLAVDPLHRARSTSLRGRTVCGEERSPIRN